MKLEPGKLLIARSRICAWPWDGGDPKRIEGLATTIGRLEQVAEPWAEIVGPDEIILPFHVQQYTCGPRTFAVVAFLWNEKNWVMFPERYMSASDTEEHWSGLAPVWQKDR